MRSFYSAGDIGDTIYGLYVMRAMGGGELLLGRRTGLGELQPREGWSEQKYMLAMTLFRSQTYISRTQWMNHVPFVDVDLNDFRKYWLGAFPHLHGRCHLIEMNCAAQGFSFVDNGPWLECGKHRAATVIIARSFRQRDPSFPWREVLYKYPHNLLFVGTADEHADFQAMYGNVRYFCTPTLESLATVINGCDLFIGNSSCPLAIAEALDKKVVLEVSMANTERAHTMSVKRNTINWQPGFVWPDL